MKNKSNLASLLCSPTDLDIPGQIVRGNKLWLHQKKRARIAEGTGQEDAVWSYDTFGLTVVIKESLLVSWPSPTCVRQTPNRNIAFCEKHKGLQRALGGSCHAHSTAGRSPSRCWGTRGRGRWAEPQMKHSGIWSWAPTLFESAEYVSNAFSLTFWYCWRASSSSSFHVSVYSISFLTVQSHFHIKMCVCLQDSIHMVLFLYR